MLNYQGIKKDSQRISETKPFMNKYNQEEINFPSEKDDWKRSEKNNATIPLNVFYLKKEKKYHAYVSRNNSNREQQVILLMMKACEAKSKGCKTKSKTQRQWHYLEVKRLSALL